MTLLRSSRSRTALTFRRTLSIVLSMLLLGLGLQNAQAGGSSLQVSLLDNQIGATAAAFDVNDPDACPDPSGVDPTHWWAWHFVAPAKSQFETNTMTVQFHDTVTSTTYSAGPSSSDPDIILGSPGSPSAKHWYVFTSETITANLVLDTVTATISGNWGNNPKIVLSHTCAPTPSTLHSTTTTTQAHYTGDPTGVADTYYLKQGETVTDVATIHAPTAQSIQIMGKVTFSYCYSATEKPTLFSNCTGASYETHTLDTVDVDETATATSAGFVPTKPGYYLLHAQFFGNDPFTNSIDGGANELITLVNKTSTTTTAGYSTADTTTVNGAVKLWSASETVTDTAVITNVSGNDGLSGVVTFKYCFSGTSNSTTWPTCASPVLIETATVAVASGTSVTVTSKGFNPAEGPGYYLMHAEFDGDGWFADSEDSSGAAEQVVLWGHTTINTSAKFDGGNPIDTSTAYKVYYINQGGNVSDSATVRVVERGTATPSYPTGSVTFYYCVETSTVPTAAGCDAASAWTAIPGSKTLSSSGLLDGVSSAISDAVNRVITAGYYLLRAVYAGAAPYIGVTDDGADSELVRILDNEPGQTSITTVASYSGETTTSAFVGHWAANETITDTAVVKNVDLQSTETPTGQVRFSYCFNEHSAPTWNSCSHIVLGLQSLTVVDSRTTTASWPGFQPSKGPGYYLLHAEYLPTASNGLLGSDDENLDGKELITLLGDTAITTVASFKDFASTTRSTYLGAGQTLRDVATVRATETGTSTTTPRGNVTFYYCYDANSRVDTCTATTTGRTLLGQVALSGGVAAYEFTASSAGYYLVHAVYEGQDPYRGSVDINVDDLEQLRILTNPTPPAPQNNPPGPGPQTEPSRQPTPEPTPTETPKTPEPTKTPEPSNTPQTPQPKDSPTPVWSEKVADVVTKVASQDIAVVGCGVPVTFKLTGPADAVYSTTKVPAHGTLSINTTTRAATWTPEPGYCDIGGNDGFVLAWKDSKGNTGTITKVVVLNKQGDIPNLIRTGQDAPPSNTPWNFVVMLGLAIAGLIVRRIRKAGA